MTANSHDRVQAILHRMQVWSAFLVVLCSVLLLGMMGLSVESGLTAEFGIGWLARAYARYGSAVVYMMFGSVCLFALSLILKAGATVLPES